MAHNDTICFGDFDGVTGAPTINGFTGIDDDGVITNESESGYVKGDRLTFGSGAASPDVFGSSSGFPPAVFQGVRNGDYLNLAFFCRFDLSFDPQDVIVIALKPSAGAPQSSARRIDIFPVYLDIGADSKVPATGGPAGDPESAPGSIGTPAGSNFHVRTDKKANKEIHYRGDAGNAWTTTNPSGGTYAPNNITVRARSWLPPSASTTSTPSIVQTVSASPTAFTLDVVDASNLPANGAVLVDGRIIRYTGKLGNRLTGCKTLLAGSIPGNTSVSLVDCGWSVEVALPLTTAVGGPDWINIPDSFALYFNIIRVGSGPGAPQQSQGNFATQFAFPFGASAGTTIVGSLNAATTIPVYGTALIPALQQPAYSNLGQGIRILNDELGVGVLDITDDNMLAALRTNIHNAAHPGADNKLVARVVNTGTTAADNATGIRAEFRFANWGLGAANFHLWAPAVGATPDQPTGISLLHGAQSAITSTWLKSAVPGNYNAPKDHQCMWVQLTSTGSSPVNFLQSSTRRNMDFVSMSEVKRPAVISGEGYPAPAGGASHAFLLVTTIRELPTFKREAAESGKRTVRWLWINHGYRKTGQNIVIDGKSFEILDDTPGAFGYVADHIGETDRFEYEFSGGGIHNLGGNVHAIDVPHGGSVEIQTAVRTVPRATPGTPGTPIPTPQPGGLKLPWWLWLLLIIIILALMFIF